MAGGDNGREGRGKKGEGKELELRKWRGEECGEKMIWEKDGGEDRKELKRE
jgi:hypothetical protein